MRRINNRTACYCSNSEGKQSNFFENKVLSKIFGLNKNEVSEQFRILQ
jgi:hypothetical protein